MMKASSLSGALVVRKGSAAPSAATPRLVTSSGGTKAATFGQRKATAAAPQPYLREAPAPAMLPAIAPPADKANRPNDAAPRGTRRTSRCGGGNGGGRGGAEKVRMTLRLTAADHLRLKLAAAHTGQNMTALIEEAIDRYLADMGPQFNAGRCACIAGDLAGRDDGGN